MSGRLLIGAVVMVLAGTAGYAQARPTCAVVPKSLAAMKGCYRPLLVFSPNGDDARLRRQVSLLDQAADDMMDRFVLYTPIVPDGRQVTTPADAPYTILDAKTMAAVRVQFHVAAGGFAVLLLDEDGSVILRTAAPVSTDRLNTVIDKTPLRQSEMLRPHAN
ncbi:MAG: DUF4174 domain-containing protein [Acidobacteriaceae bacterium]